MVKITTELLRKRAEHNEGCLSSLEEITLHQFDIEKIELVGEVCRKLRILYLQHNLIERIENLHHLKYLKYLNLAINSIRRIEGLEQCEDLEKLDLTVNCVDDLLSVDSLKKNSFLKELFLTGNPCSAYKGYRLFVIHTLPQLKSLDGKIITRDERIEASQKYEEILKYLQYHQPIFIQRNSKEMEDLAKNPKFSEDGKRLYGNDPISRKLAAAEVTKEKEKSKKKEGDHKSPFSRKKPPKKQLTYEEEIRKYGKVMQRNEGKWDFKFREIDADRKSKDENVKYGQYVLTVPVGKYCLTSNIGIDVQPKFVEIKVRGKRLVLRFEEEVASGKAIAERARTNGNLKITVPKVPKDEKSRIELSKM